MVSQEHDPRPEPAPSGSSVTPLTRRDLLRRGGAAAAIAAAATWLPTMASTVHAAPAGPLAGDLTTWQMDNVVPTVDPHIDASGEWVHGDVATLIIRARRQTTGTPDHLWRLV
nr:hypothetical protein OH820_15780 [Streptomyces sp. NBC_00857]